MHSKSQFLIIVFLVIAHCSFSQQKDSTKAPFRFAGAFFLTNNGISLIPTFSLGEPAVIVNLYMGKRFSFEPDLRFSLKGKPWSFIFWFRYKLVQQDKFRFTVGLHPAMNFRTVISLPDSNEIIVGRRYFAGELAPNYFISRNVSIGVYYLYSRGIDKEAVRNTHFLTLNSTISDIKLFWDLALRFTPQVYYLKQNEEDGFYGTATLALARKNFPLSALAIFNKTIESDITASKNFIWSISLVFSFNKVYAEK